MKLENIIRTIGYLILMALSVAIYYVLHSHFHFILLIIMSIAPVLSIIMVILLRKYTTAEINVLNSDYGVENGILYFEIKLNNPTILTSLDVKLNTTVKNEFFGHETKVKFSVPLNAKKGYTMTIPLEAKLPGRYCVTLDSIEIKDLMGFCFLKKKIDVDTDIAVMPELLTDIIYEKSELSQGMLESEESSKKGNDFSDVQEIREYIPGDKLMSIHWKLSAKRDVLMVKDRVSMSDRQLVVLPELSSDSSEYLAAILESTYSMIKILLEDKTTVRLMYWSKKAYQYEEVRIDYREELDAAFARMYYESTYPGMDEAASHMSTVNPHMKSYLHIYVENGKTQIKIKENC